MTVDGVSIINADASQFKEVRGFYHSLIDAIEDPTCSAGWKKDIYPSQEFLKGSIDRGELIIALSESQIVGAMVLNHLCNDGYKQFDWPTEASGEEILVIHALGVHSKWSGRGYARSLVTYAIDAARKGGQKVIRLDVLKGNVRAEKLYTGMGFKYLHTLPMFYEDTGWTDYMLYEYVI